MNVEVSATIRTVYPIESDFKGDNVQKLLLSNASTATRGAQVNPQMVLVVRTDPSITIHFAAGDPIVARGRYDPGAGIGQLPTLQYAHAPTGFIRYNGQVFR